MARNPRDPSNGYTIRQLADEFDVSPRTLRFYEEKGLIEPERTPGGQRRFSRRHRARLKLILRGKRLGFSLEEIAEMIGHADVNLDEAEQIRRSLEYGRKKLEEIDAHIQELENLRRDIRRLEKRLTNRLEQLEGEEGTGNVKKYELREDR